MEGRKTLNILITEPDNYSEEAVIILNSIGTVTMRRVTYKGLMDTVHDFHVLVIRLGLTIDKEIIEKGKNLRYIVSPTTGIDHIDYQWAAKKGVELITLQGEQDFLKTIPSTAEFTWGLLLSLLRNIPSAIEDVKAARWDRDKFRGNNLKGRRLGILGLGRVGKQVAAYGKVFGMDLAAHDPFQPEWVDGVIKKETLESLLQWCDILTIHIPYNEDTRLLLNESTLKNLRYGSFIVNTSRAGIWNEQHILELLDSGYLKGVATDVISEERGAVDNHPMIRFAALHSNLIITPHLGGATIESMQMTEVFVANKLKHTLGLCVE